MNWNLIKTDSILKTLSNVRKLIHYDFNHLKSLKLKNIFYFKSYIIWFIKVSVINRQNLNSSNVAVQSEKLIAFISCICCHNWQDGTGFEFYHAASWKWKKKQKSWLNGIVGQYFHKGVLLIFPFFAYPAKFKKHTEFYQTTILHHIVSNIIEVDTNNNKKQKK